MRVFAGEMTVLRMQAKNSNIAETQHLRVFAGFTMTGACFITAGFSRVLAGKWLKKGPAQAR